MGNTNSTEVDNSYLKKEAYQVVHVVKDSPADKIGLVSYFDYLISLPPVRTYAASPLSYEVYVKDILSTQSKLDLWVFNLATSSIRKLTLTLSRYGGKAMLDLTGFLIRPIVISEAIAQVEHIQDVNVGSLAFKAGLVPIFDYIFATDEGDCFDLHEIIPRHQPDDNLRVYVFDILLRTSRIVCFNTVIKLGENRLGCTLASGYLHRIPTVELEFYVKNPTKNALVSFKSDTTTEHHHHANNAEHSCNDHDHDEHGDSCCHTSSSFNEVFQVDQQQQKNITTNVVVPPLSKLAQSACNLANPTLASIKLPLPPSVDGCHCNAHTHKHNNVEHQHQQQPVNSNTSQVCVNTENISSTKIIKKKKSKRKQVNNSKNLSFDSAAQDNNLLTFVTQVEIAPTPTSANGNHEPVIHNGSDVKENCIKTATTTTTTINGNISSSSKTSAIPVTVQIPKEIMTNVVANLVRYNVDRLKKESIDETNDKNTNNDDVSNKKV